MRLLFIGNSHTYCYSVPHQCRELMAALGIEARVFMITQPGKSLSWHGGNPATQSALKFDSWDHIILQQASHPFGGRAELEEGIEGLLDLMVEGQSVRLYKTWCEKEIQENQSVIDEAFAAASERFNIPVIPVSDAWHQVEKRDPGHELYDSDARHAGEGGSYLTSLCMARALTGKQVTGLPTALSSNGRAINSVPNESAALYQAVVDDLV
jgi:hypothetical protein